MEKRDMVKNLGREVKLWGARALLAASMFLGSLPVYGMSCSNNSKVEKLNEKLNKNKAKVRVLSDSLDVYKVKLDSLENITDSLGFYKAKLDSLGNVNDSLKGYADSIKVENYDLKVFENRNREKIRKLTFKNIRVNEINNGLENRLTFSNFPDSCIRDSSYKNLERAGYTVFADSVGNCYIVAESNPVASRAGADFKNTALVDKMLNTTLGNQKEIYEMLIDKESIKANIKVDENQLNLMINNYLKDNKIDIEEISAAEFKDISNLVKEKYSVSQADKVSKEYVKTIVDSANGTNSFSTSFADELEKIPFKEGIYVENIEDGARFAQIDWLKVSSKDVEYLNNNTFFAKIKSQDELIESQKSFIKELIDKYNPSVKLGYGVGSFENGLSGALSLSYKISEKGSIHFEVGFKTPESESESSLYNVNVPGVNKAETIVRSEDGKYNFTISASRELLNKDGFVLDVLANCMVNFGNYISREVNINGKTYEEDKKYYNSIKGGLGFKLTKELLSGVDVYGKGVIGVGSYKKFDTGGAIKNEFKPVGNAGIGIEYKIGGH